LLKPEKGVIEDSKAELLKVLDGTGGGNVPSERELHLGKLIETESVPLVLGS